MGGGVSAPAQGKKLFQLLQTDNDDGLTIAALRERATSIGASDTDLEALEAIYAKADGDDNGVLSWEE